MNASQGRPTRSAARNEHSVLASQQSSVAGIFTSESAVFHFAFYFWLTVDIHAVYRIRVRHRGSDKDKLLH